MEENGRVLGGVETFQDSTQVEQLQKESQEKYTLEDIIGRNPSMKKLFAILPRIAGIADEVMNRLMEYVFPGNVRELENIIEHAFILCRGGLIELHHLSAEVDGRGIMK
jgi:transcriptional regulator with PAS, ATPase and Fis domain